MDPTEAGKKNSAYNRYFRAFSGQFARIFCMGAIAEP
jgi:hypothetical protein